MTPCERYQAQLLDHLYDLLEAGERQELVAHLSVCGPCQAALEQTRGQQRLIAAAAKSKFEGVRFEKPAAETTAIPAAPATPILLMPAKPRPSRSLVRWAAAAAILLILFSGLGVSGKVYWTGAANYQDQLAQATTGRQEIDAKLNAAAAPSRDKQQLVEKLVEEQHLLARKQIEKHEEIARTAVARQRYVTVTGPDTIQDGAANVFHIAVRDLGTQQPVAAKLRPRLVNDLGKDIVSDKLLALEPQGPGEYRLSLPRNLDLKSATNVLLELATEDEKRTTAAKDATDASSFRTALKIARPVYITHLATDKPMYQPGQTVWFRSLTVERFSLKPADEPLHLVYTITDANGGKVTDLTGSTQLVDAKNQTILGPDKKPIKGLGSGSFPIPPNFAGGEYTLTVADRYNHFPPEQRKFLVNEYQKSALSMKLEYTKTSYGFGDEVVANCSVKPAAGGRPVARQPVTATVRIDGKTYDADGMPSEHGLKFQTDEAGAVLVKFRLPTKIDRGQASVSVQFTDGANVDAIVRSIPIVVKKFYVQLYPEGGDLVAGVPNRVYFQARTTLDKPAEVVGRVVDQDARVIARLETLNDAKEPGANQGMGMFELTPVAGKKYALQIDTPAGIVAEYEFPAIKAEGVVLNVPKGVMAPSEALRVRVNDSEGGRTLLVGAYCRGRLLAHETFQSKKGEFQEIALKPEGGAGGVYRVTVFEQRDTTAGRQFVPRAERLVYRAPAESLKLTMHPHRQRFMPGENARLTINALDETGKPAPAIIMMSVVDTNVLSMMDEKTARAMPTQLFLGTEIRKPEDFEHADFLLGEHPKAATALDLLLGTQGWRRFAEQNPEEFQKLHGQDAARMLAAAAFTPIEINNRPQAEAVAAHAIRQEQDRLAFDNSKHAAEIQEKLGKAQTEAAQADAAIAAQLAGLRQDANRLDSQRSTLVSRLQDYNSEWRFAGMLAIGVALALIGMVGVIIGLLRKGRAGMPYFATALCSVLVLAMGLIWVNMEKKQGTFQTVADRLGGYERLAKHAAAPNADWGEQPGMGVRGMVEHFKDEPKKAEPRDHADAKAKMVLPARPALMEGAPGGFGGAPPPPPANRANAPEEERIRRAGDDGGPAAPKLNEDRARKELDAGLRKTADVTRAAVPTPKGDPRMRAPLPAAADQKRVMQGAGGGKFDKAKAEMPHLELKAADKYRRFVVPPGTPPAGPVPVGPGAGGRGAMRLPGGGDGYVPGITLQQPYVPPPPPSLMIREFAYRRSLAFKGERSDFTETLAWHPALVLTDGHGQITFDLSDSLTTFQALVYGHTPDGRMGVGKVEIESRLPFSVTPKVPTEVTNSDTLVLPVTVSNDSEDKRNVNLTAKGDGLKLDGPAQVQLGLDANQKSRRLYRFTPDLIEGEATLQIDGRTEGFFNDSVKKSIRVVPDGFPISGSRSDVLEKIARNEIVLPETWIKGTLKAQVQVYPSTLADLQKGLEGLLREPHGCFEQTSTSNYPNVLILDYLRENDQAKPEVAQRARELLDRGYQKLTSFECLKTGQNAREGYEWFGGAAPPHEALTAYGLLQFRDMARVYNVDGGMVERTKTYLMSRRDGQGGFARNARALDTFGRAPDDITNAYIVWALTESSKDDNLDKELGALKAQAKASQDAYFVALVANSVLNRNDNEFGAALLKKLAEAQKPDGHLDGARTSITGSGGRTLQIETTALTLLAWLKANRPEFTPNVQSAVKWIGQQRGGGGAFGSTQSTILALKALIAHAKASKRPAEAGDLVVYVGSEQVEKQRFVPNDAEMKPLEIKNPERFLKAGKNDVRIEVTGNNVFPYTLSWSYQTLKPASAEACPVQLEAKLNKTTADENETVQLTVSVKNVSGKGQGMTVAIVGLPAGLTLPEDMKQLKDFTRLQDNDTKPGKISAWEIRGRELVLYWRDLAPNAQTDVPLELICRIPGQFRGPASRAYLYYNSDAKHWVEPLSIKIEPRE